MKFMPTKFGSGVTAPFRISVYIEKFHPNIRQYVISLISYKYAHTLSKIDTHKIVGRLTDDMGQNQRRF